MSTPTLTLTLVLFVGLLLVLVSGLALAGLAYVTLRPPAWRSPSTSWAYSPGSSSRPSWAWSPSPHSPPDPRGPRPGATTSTRSRGATALRPTGRPLTCPGEFSQ
ncbi:hypothetical protein [Streptomyces clavifer]|uniref:hypothetical protein n=1 Tax=Streptomyces clavifer TaxID=68188 RepID=UPI00371C407C